MNRQLVLAGGLALSLIGVAGAWFILDWRRAQMEDPPPVTYGPVINAPQRRTASSHPMDYYVSLPSGWSKARQWPVVVAIEGSGKDWLGSANKFASVRDAKGYPFIIVTPIVLTNGGRDLRHRHAAQYAYADSTWDAIARTGSCAFDRDGVRAAVADVERDYNGESKPFLAGHSAGGHFTVASVLTHPELFRGVAVAAGNYLGRCVDGPTVEPKPDDPQPVPQEPISAAAERVSLPVRFFNGKKDNYGKYLVPQRDRAIADAKSHGFRNLSFVTVPNVGHDPMVSLVLDYFSSLLGPNER